MTELGVLIQAFATDALQATVAPKVGSVLTPYVPEMRQGSLLNLAMGLAALSMNGMSGSMTFHIPRKITDRIEVEWSSNPIA
jgi:hypothetical protein